MSNPSPAAYRQLKVRTQHGKPSGRLGVTHVLGIRAFRTRLLCEQVKSGAILRAATDRGARARGTEPYGLRNSDPGPFQIATVYG
jgi:hypothetical protein